MKLKKNINFGGKPSTEFHPVFPFSSAPPMAATEVYIFTAPNCTTTTIISLKPCALDAELQHFILRFNKKMSFTLRIPLKRRDMW
jgi:hypothetical protein